METIKIEGMGCGKCTAAVKNALEEVAGVKIIEVDTGFAKIEASGEALEAAKAAIIDAGYDVV